MHMDGMAGWAMMNLVSSLLIVTLFAFWVRELKHQILGMQKLPSPTVSPPEKLAAAAPQRNVLVHHAEPKPQAGHAAATPPAPRHAIHRTREGNVPVWTIE
jgi:hypothetical protein